MSNKDIFIENNKTKKELQEILSSKKTLLESINLRIEFLISKTENKK